MYYYNLLAEAYFCTKVKPYHYNSSNNATVYAAKHSLSGYGLHKRFFKQQRHYFFSVRLRNRSYHSPVFKIGVNQTISKN